MSSNGFLRALARPVRVLSVLSVVAAGLASMPVAVAAPPVSAPKAAKTVAEASRLAAQYKTAVEVDEKTNEYMRTVATPQGTLSAEVSNEPVRVRRDSGWVAIDTTLAVRGDGMIAPKAATSDIAFSGGGTGVLARFKQDDNTFDLKSPWALPAPTLQGSKATYSAVLPGVDLVVEATTAGFSYNLVVLNRQAAANPALKALTFPVSTQNLELRNNQIGRPSYVDGKGREILTVGEPLMWDSTGSSSKAKANSAAAVDEGATGQAKRALMELTGTAQGLTVKPDQKLLTAADTVFPVVIDPTVNPTMTRTAAKAGWTAAWELYPTTSFWNTTHSLGVGYEGWSQSKIVRSYFQFKVGGFAGKKIISAYFRAYETHSASCAARQVIVSRTSPISSATTWNKQPTRQADVASATVAKGYSGCPAGTVEFNVTNSIQYTSTANGSVTTFGMRAGDETDRIAWKQFDSGANLTIEYIAYPLPAYELGAATDTDAPTPCAPSTDPTIVASLRPQVSAKGRVGAGDTSASVFVQFQVISPSQTGVILNSPLVAPGVLVKEAPEVSLAANTLYTYRARTVYNYDGGQLISAWSPSCYLKIDTSPPPMPTITAKYGSTAIVDCWNNPNPDTCPAGVPAGGQVTYTISSTSTDVVALSYGFNGKLVRVNGRSVTISVVAPLQTFMILEAKSHDAAEHPSSQTAAHKLKVGPALPPVGAWSLNEGSGTTAADSSAANRPLTVTGAAWDDAGRAGGSLTFNGVNSGDNRATVAGQTVDTSGNFSISAWVRPTAATDAGVVTITGANAFGGMLRYNAAQARWVFSQSVSDSGTAASASVQSDGPSLLNTWTHLVGVYGATNKKLYLYVNGRLQGTAVAFTHTPWKAAGAVEVGSYRVDALKGVFSGAIDEVKIFPRAISGEEIMSLANPRVSTKSGDEPVAGLVASYPFDAVAGGRTADSVYGADMTVSGFGADPATAITEDPDRGTVLTTTGSTGESVSLNRPVIDASGSFTVTAWVKLSDTSKPRVIVRQAGAKDSWRLGYRPPTDQTGAVWAFSMSSSGSAVPVEVTQRTDPFIAEVWTPLVGYYDAANGKLVLMVGDRSGDDGDKAFEALPITSGTTVVAGPPATGSVLPFAGSLDDLHVYAGVVPLRQLCTDLGEEEECL